MTEFGLFLETADKIVKALLQGFGLLTVILFAYAHTNLVFSWRDCSVHRKLIYVLALLCFIGLIFTVPVALIIVSRHR